MACLGFSLVTKIMLEQRYYELKIRYIFTSGTMSWDKNSLGRFTLVI